MYTDQKAPAAIRGQAQGMLVFLTQGVGMFFGYKIMAAGTFLGIDLGWKIGKYGEQVTKGNEYTDALTAARGEQEAVGFLQSFTQMFSRHLPDGLDTSMLNETMTQWKNFWMFPSIMAAIILAVFALNSGQSQNQMPTKTNLNTCSYLVKSFLFYLCLTYCNIVGLSLTICSIPLRGLGAFRPVVRSARFTTDCQELRDAIVPKTVE